LGERTSLEEGKRRTKKNKMERKKTDAEDKGKMGRRSGSILIGGGGKSHNWLEIKRKATNDQSGKRESDPKPALVGN